MSETDPQIVAAGRAPQVFISYRHVPPDDGLAEALSAFLRGRGIGVFVDKQIKVGRLWWQEIDRHLRASTAFVVFISPASILSDMVRQEVLVAHSLLKAGQLSIFPVRVDFEGELPYDLAASLNPIQYALWRQGGSVEDLCRVLHGALTDGEALPLAAAKEDPALAVLTDSASADERRGAPLPAADPRIVLETGTIRPASPFYLRRPVDDLVQRSLGVRGATIIVKGPRQSGKSSLLARVHALARKTSQRSVYLDFQMFDASQLAGLTMLLQSMATKIGRALKASVTPHEMWDPARGAKESFAIFMEAAALQPSDRPVVLLLDEVDRVFDQEYRGDFFAAVRGWHNMRATDEPWENLNLVLAHATEPALWIQDLNQSPFNIGESFRLGDFTAEEVWELNCRHHLPLRERTDLDALMRLVGGHPYLIRQALYVLATKSQSLAQLAHTAADDLGPFGDHLRRHLWQIGRSPGLGKALSGVIRDGVCEQEDLFQRLLAAGLVVGETRLAAQMRCELYQVYFARHL